MFLRHKVRSLIGTSLLAGIVSVGMNSFIQAEETPKASSRLKGLQVQPGDEPLRAFEPSKAAPANENGKRDAMALYMKGRIEQEQGRFSEALKSFLAAIDKDPQAIDAYRGALPILLQRQEIDRARKLTLAAAEQDLAGFDLVIAMGSVFARQSELSNGIQLLQEALALPSLKPKSLQDLYMRRDLGLYLRAQGNFAKAAEEYKYVFDAIRDPQLDKDILEKLLIEPGKLFDDFGDVFLKAEQPELALEAFAEAKKYRDSKPGIHSFNLATVFRQTGKPEKALEELQHYFDAQMQTRGRAAYELLQELLVELKREKELIPQLQEMYKQDEHNDSLRYFLADQILKSGDLEQATQLYTNGRDKITDPRALVGMLSVYRQQKNSEKLLGVLTRAFSTVPRGDDKAALQQMAPDVRTLADRFEEEIQALLKDEEAFTELTKYTRSLETGDESKLEFIQAYLLGKLCSENNRIEDAVHFYKVAISMRNDPPPLLFTELSSQLIDSQHYAEAVEILNEAIQHPSSGLQRERWRFMYLLSYALAFQGKTEEALEVIHDAQKLQPIPMMQYQEAWIVYHARRWDEAIALFEQIIANHPDDKDLINRCRFHISNIYVEQGDMARGEKVLEDVLAEHPDNPQANNDLGYLFADQGKHLERAESMIRKALTAEPDNHAYLDSLGWVLYRQGKYKEALESLEKASKRKQGDDATIIDHLADCLDKLGRHEEAIAAWQRALKVEEAKTQPTEKLIKSLREKLKLPEKEEKAPEKEAEKKK